MQESGLRERKKQRTRAEIVAAAVRLFRERGFESTTVADIAAAADIAPRTFFGYFRSKEDVLFHDFEDLLEAFTEQLRARAPGETTFDALRAWASRFVDEDAAVHAERRARHDVVEASPTLAGHDRANVARFQAVLAEAVAADLGDHVETLRPQLVAAAAMAALEALGGWKDDVHGEDALVILDEALAFLAGGLEALRRRGG